jgi:virginiamycin B lyase
MRRILIFLLLFAVTCGLQFLPAVQAADMPGLEITEWQVPWENARPRDPWRGPDGKV